MRRQPPRSPLFPSTTLSRSLAVRVRVDAVLVLDGRAGPDEEGPARPSDRKRTRLKSTHEWISRMPSFFLNETATTEISPLSLHDALPISRRPRPGRRSTCPRWSSRAGRGGSGSTIRSEEDTSEIHSRVDISDAVFFFK